ncbi:hypothetical protein [Phytoactinopolyspora limicola]|uniref:hypothetical protein n=1 Tax=Phytoactinopolyspora limicola TaxID=2715536 RepID=UPI001409874C|nr:hypothetical protein [Phytoactinopolyspora limicola]
MVLDPGQTHGVVSAPGVRVGVERVGRGGGVEAGDDRRVRATAAYLGRVRVFVFAVVGGAVAVVVRGARRVVAVVVTAACGEGKGERRQGGGESRDLHGAAPGVAGDRYMGKRSAVQLV